MPFTTTSLKSRERKRKIKETFFSLRNVGIASASAGVMGLLLFPIFLWKKMKTQEKQIKKRRGFLSFIAIATTFFLLVGFFWDEIKEQGKEHGLETISSVMGAELPKDKHGFTNFLLMGSGGGDLHADKGHKMTDSIMIVSLDTFGRSVVLLSIPRDFFIEPGALDLGEGQTFTELTKKKGTRINSIIRDLSNVFFWNLRGSEEYQEKRKGKNETERKHIDWEIDAIATEKAEKMFKVILEDVFDIELHRTVKIDFKGFQEGVDAIGGIDVVVEKGIYDPCYPNFEWGYDKFYLEPSKILIDEAGNEILEKVHLDGKNALKFARSRHNFYKDGGNNSASCSWAMNNMWDRSSDFDRAARQQKVVSALKEKATSGDLFTLERIQNILEVIDDNYESDLTWSEMITLADFGQKFDRDRIASFVLTNRENLPGGFLVTPNRELYGGAFVLVPWRNERVDKYAQLHAFNTIIFQYREFAGIDPVDIEILNGTSREKRAEVLKTALERFGLSIGKTGNYKTETEEDLTETTIRFTNTPKNRVAADILQTFFSAKLEPLTEEQTYAILEPKIEEEKIKQRELFEKKAEDLREKVNAVADDDIATIQALEEQIHALTPPEEIDYPIDIFQVLIGTDIVPTTREKDYTYELFVPDFSSLKNNGNDTAQDPS